MFGAVVGYIAWYAVLPGKKDVDLKTVSSFMGVVGGGAILALFPAKTDLFLGYCWGLGVGFFSNPISNWWRMKIQRETEEDRKQREEDRKQREEDRKEILEDWNRIEASVRATLKEHTMIHPVNLGLSFSEENKKFILEEFARSNPDEAYLDGSKDNIYLHRKWKSSPS